MATSRRIFLIGASFTSVLAVILALTALGTEYWIDSSAVYNVSPESQGNKIHYGLFKGSESSSYAVQATYELVMTCLFDDNVCAVLCGAVKEDREALLKNFYDDPSFNETSKDTCVALQRGIRFYQDPLKANPKGERTFINAGILVSTIFFLCLASAFGLISAGLTFWNVIDNPVQLLFSIFGLYIYNGIAFVSTLLYIILWGAMYASTLCKDIAIQDTITAVTSSDGRANLGYSYWINLASLVLYAASLGLIYARSYLIASDPIKQKEIELETSENPTIFLF